MADEATKANGVADLPTPELLAHVQRVLGEFSIDVIRGRVRAELQTALGDDATPLKRVIESVDRLAASLQSEAKQIDDLRAGLRAVHDKATHDEVRAIATQTIAPINEGLRSEVDAVRRRLDDEHARIATIADRTSEAHLDRLVDEAARRVGETLFTAKFATSIEELRTAFEDADDRYTQLKQLIDHAGPGGAPVLRQANDELHKELERVRADLQRERETSRQRSEDLAKKEAELIQKTFAQGLPSLEELDERRRDLEAREREVRDRVSLQSEIQRLSSQLQSLQNENDAWRQQSFTAQQAEVDAKALELYKDEARETARALDSLQATLNRTRDESTRVRRERDEIRTRVLDLEAREQAVDAYQRRIALLEQEIKDLTRAHEEALAHADEMRQASLGWQREFADRVTENEKLRGSQHRSIRDALERQQVEFDAQLDARATLEAERLAGTVAAENRRLRGELERLEGVEDSHRRLEIENQRLRDAHDLLNKRQQALEDLREEINKTRLDELIATNELARANILAEAQRQRAELDEQVDAKRTLVQELERTRLEIERRVLDIDAKRAQIEVKLDALRVEEAQRRETLAQLDEPIFSVGELTSPSTVTDETVWLGELETALQSTGFTFHTRLVRAFHTSLKIARHAPITILAGISGTGKSELPRLYSELGGLSFLNIPVQPGWDSPNNLFGFYNYTDSRYRAEPLARLFRQVSNENDPLRSGMSLVLLDEMNLARVEYYFSELLSRLEARRAVADESDRERRRRASILLDVGARSKEVELYLDERVLFVGTMNEDESTLSLSSKVLDRSCLLSFPAPRGMSLKEQKSAPTRRERISCATWRSWVQNERDDENSNRLNEINHVMELLGQPFGHRLFRAIHAYIANYPGKDEAAKHAAWSDQWAMKILPRLRGLECGDEAVGRGLDDLAQYVPEELRGDFDRARQGEYFRFAGASGLYVQP
jgi:hypothetical protein